jgi:very-short-patch-repair endonuclease
LPTRYPDQQLSQARQLRRNTTNAEATLWRALRGSRLGGLNFGDSLLSDRTSPTSYVYSIV